jgi:hypothetical protein
LLGFFVLLYGSFIHAHSIGYQSHPLNVCFGDAFVFFFREGDCRVEPAICWHRMMLE